MWTTERTDLDHGAGEKIVIASAGRALSFGEVIAGWKTDAAFRTLFIGLLADAPTPAFFWETPPIRRGRLDMRYEHVVIPADALARMRPDPLAFKSAFDTRPVATFRNLGGDALLVAPRPMGDLETYGHFAAFLRSGPPEQQHELFRVLAAAIEDTLEAGDAPLWISTSGLGVAWLHVRLDSWPKYYNYRPYADAR